MVMVFLDALSLAWGNAQTQGDVGLHEPRQCPMAPQSGHRCALTLWYQELELGGCVPQPPCGQILAPARSVCGQSGGRGGRKTNYAKPRDYTQPTRLP